MDLKKLHTEAQRLNSKGNQHVTKKQFSEAITSFRKALEIHVQLGHYIEQSVILTNIAVVYEQQDNSSMALQTYLKALDICKKANYPQGTIIPLTKIAFIYRHSKDFKKAKEFLVQLLEVLRQLNLHRKQELVLQNLVQVTQAGGEFEETIKYFMECAKVTKTEVNRMHIFCQIGELSYTLKKFDQAHEYYQKGIIIAKDVAKEEENSDHVSRIFRNMISITLYLKKLKRYDKSLEFSHKLLALKENTLKASIKENAGRMFENKLLNNIGEIQFFQKKYEEAVKFFEHVYNNHKESSDEPGESIANCMNNLGTLHEKLKDMPKSEMYFSDALKIFKRTGNLEAQTINLKCLSQLKDNSPEKTVEYLQQLMAVLMKRKSVEKKSLETEIKVTTDLIEKYKSLMVQKDAEK